MHETQLFKLHPRVLDVVVGRILVPSHISVFHSEERFPLTALAHAVLIGAGRSKRTSIYLDSGSNFSPQLIRILSPGHHGDVLERIKIANPLSLSDLELILESVESEDCISLVIIDSLTGIMNMSAAPGSKERQRQLYRTLDSIRETVLRMNVHLMITDHSARNWRTGQHRPVGGNVIEHAVDTVVAVTTLNEIPDGVRINIERTPIAPNPGGVILKIGHKGIRSLKSP